jgi:hypothetical protein
MSAKKDVVFGFKFADIDTHEFATVDENFKDSEPSNLTINVNYGLNPEVRAIGIKFKFQYEQKKKPFLIIAATCGFEIEKKAWAKLLDKESNKLIIPEDFASHLAVLTVGTIRGILHEKTKGTPYNKFILPPINLTDLIKQDVEIDLEKLEEAK